MAIIEYQPNVRRSPLHWRRLALRICVACIALVVFFGPRLDAVDTSPISYSIRESSDVIPSRRLTVFTLPPTHMPPPSPPFPSIAMLILPVTTNQQWEPIFRTFNGVEMALVPPGCFMMGSTLKQVEDGAHQLALGGLIERDMREQISDEMPSTRTCFDRVFWIDTLEVSQAQFSLFNGKAKQHPVFSGDNRPVEMITWFEAHSFCISRGARLPSEAEVQPYNLTWVEYQFLGVK